MYMYLYTCICTKCIRGKKVCVERIKQTADSRFGLVGLTSAVYAWLHYLHTCTLSSMYTYCIHAVCPSDLSSWGERVESILMALLTFCQRNSSKLASEDKARQVHMYNVCRNMYLTILLLPALSEPLVSDI